MAKHFLSPEKVVRTIQRRALLARWIENLGKQLVIVLWSIGGLILLDRQWGEGEIWFWSLALGAITPLTAFAMAWRQRLSKMAAWSYLDSLSGGSGRLLTLAMVCDERWREPAVESMVGIAGKLPLGKGVQFRQFSWPLLFVIMAWITPLLESGRSAQASAIVKAEKAKIAEQIARIEEILPQEEAEIAQMVENLAGMSEDAQDMDDALEALEAMEDSLMHQGEQMEKALEQAQSAMEQGEPSKAIAALEKEQMLSPQQVAQLQSKQENGALSPQQQQQLTESMEKAEQQLQKMLSNEDLQRMIPGESSMEESEAGQSSSPSDSSPLYLGSHFSKNKPIPSP